MLTLTDEACIAWISSWIFTNLALIWLKLLNLWFSVVYSQFCYSLHSPTSIMLVILRNEALLFPLKSPARNLALIPVRNVNRWCSIDYSWLRTVSCRNLCSSNRNWFCVKERFAICWKCSSTLEFHICVLSSSNGIGILIQALDINYETLWIYQFRIPGKHKTWTKQARKLTNRAFESTRTTFCFCHGAYKAFHRTFRTVPFQFLLYILNFKRTIYVNTFLSC